MVFSGSPAAECLVPRNATSRQVLPVVADLPHAQTRREREDQPRTVPLESHAAAASVVSLAALHTAATREARASCERARVPTAAVASERLRADADSGWRLEGAATQGCY